MKIDIVYDLLCPWCLVGKRQLDIALDRTGPPSPDIAWHQFMLYPHFDRAGHDFLAFFRQRYGEDLRVPMWDRIRAVAEPIGIRFAFERITRGPASLDGHRLVRWAERQRPGSAAALIETIASGFFEQAHIIDFAFLARAAQTHGFDHDAALAHLASDNDMTEPFAETEQWVGQGVTSMPHFMLTFADGTRRIVRQTSVETFVEAFEHERRLSAEGASA